MVEKEINLKGCYFCSVFVLVLWLTKLRVCLHNRCLLFFCWFFGKFVGRSCIFSGFARKAFGSEKVV